MKRFSSLTVKRRYLDLGLAIASILGGVLLLIYLSTTPWSKAETSAINNPGFFPDITAKAIVIVGIVLLVRSLLNFKNSEVVTINVWSFVIVVLWWLYVMLMEHLGFIIASVLIVSISMAIWGVKNKVTILVCSIAVPVVLYVVFGMGLGVRFPMLF